MFIDLPLDQLRMYLPEQDAPPDFDAFWTETLQQTRQFPLGALFTLTQTPLKFVDAFDVTFNGYGGQPIKAWLLVPQGQATPMPCVVEYLGYGGGRGFPHDWPFWGAAGYAHLIMDTRGQGSGWRQGHTPDVEDTAGNPQYPGFMTRGVLDPQTYYYRRVFVDAVRAIEAAMTHPAIDPHRVAVTGVSQGGGIALAMGMLAPHIAAIMPDVPFLCHFRVATTITDSLPYGEIAHYCKIHREHIDQVFTTLSYFDGVHFASRAKVPALFSTALMDDICPPRTVFAAFNHYQGPKEIRVWPFNGHEGGESYQTLERVTFLNTLFAD